MSDKGDALGRQMIMNEFLRGRTLKEIVDIGVGMVFGLTIALVLYVFLQEYFIIIVFAILLFLIPCVWYMFYQTHLIVKNALMLASADAEEQASKTDDGGSVDEQTSEKT